MRVKLPFRFVVHLSREDEKTDKKIKKYGLTGLFRYASKWDVLLMIGGTLSAIVVGSAGPVLGIVFGAMTNSFTRASVYGISDDSEVFNSSYTDEIAASRGSLSSYDRSPIPADEFNSDMTTFSLYYLCIGLAVLVCEYALIYLWELSCERQVKKLRKLFFEQVLRQDIEWFDSQQYGDLSSKLSDDLERVKEGIGHKFGIVIQYLSTMVAGFVVGMIANWQLTCVLLAIAPIVMGSSAHMAKVMSGGAARELLKYSFAGKVAEEVLTCIRTVSAFGGERLEISRYEMAIDKGRKAAIMKYYKLSPGAFFVPFITYASYGFAFWYSAKLIADGSASVGSVFTVFFSVMAGALGIGPMLPYLNSVSIAMGSADTILQIVDRKPQIDPYSDEGLKPGTLKGKIEFRNVHFTYPSRQNCPVLKGLSFSVNPGQKVAFIGSSGAGKSTIVNLLMRFYDVTLGQVLIDDIDTRNVNLKWLRQHVGLVSQEPVLFGVSIADNIRYGREGVSLEEIIKAASLANAHDFIKDLPQGYDTPVGDRGTQISGGQKQRIAIARALVRDPKVLLLDEATSALDARSENEVQAALDSAMKGRTTLIIAHRLSTIRNADMIVAMKEGVAVESGTHDQLMALKGLYFDLVKIQKKEEKELTATTHNLGAGDDDNLDRISLASRGGSVEDGTINKRQSVLLRLMKLNSPEWLTVSIGLLSCAAIGIVAPLFAFFYAQVFATFQLEKSKMEEDTSFWASMFVGLGVISGVAMLTQVLSMSSSAEHLLARIRVYCFRSILKQQISWFDHEENSCGRLMTLLSREAPIVKYCSGLRIGQFVGNGCTLVAALTIAFMYGWKLSCILALSIPVLVYTSYKQMSSLRNSLILNTEGVNAAGKIASEGVKNVKTVQSLGSQLMFVDQYVKALEGPFKDNKKQAIWLGMTCAVAYAIPYVVYSAAFRLGAYLITIKEMTPADVYRVFFSLSMSAASIGGTAAYFQDVEKGKMAAKLLFKIIDKKSASDPTSDDGCEHELRGGIVFENVYFSYPSRPDVRILRGLSLSVAEGETVALVGESGSGKSTVISLLERFYSPTSGEIKVDGIDVDKIKLSSLRSQMGIVTQEPVLFSGTIKYNIAYGLLDREVTDQDIIEAAKLANIHDFITTLPLGYDTPCGDRGTQMSGGQKQRIAIARALLRNPKVLLLDEATSALDVESEKVVQQALDKAKVGRTSIVVSHRLSTIQNADKIIVISKGRIVESGNHEELMIRKGFYYQLAKRQQM